MEVKARLRYLRIAPRKTRLVADLIKGLKIEEARAVLRFQKKRAAKPILKLLESAIANAKHNFKLLESDLYVKDIRVDQGPMLKRWMPRAMGRATMIQKKSSHVTLVLSVLEEEKGEEGKKEEQKNKEAEISESKEAKLIEEKRKEIEKLEKEVEKIEKEKKIEAETKEEETALPKTEKQTLEEKSKIKPTKKPIIKRIFRRKSV